MFLQEVNKRQNLKSMLDKKWSRRRIEALNITPWTLEKSQSKNLKKLI